MSSLPWYFLPVGALLLAPLFHALWLVGSAIYRGADIDLDQRVGFSTLRGALYHSAGGSAIIGVVAATVLTDVRWPRAACFLVFIAFMVLAVREKRKVAALEAQQ